MKGQRYSGNLCPFVFKIFLAYAIIMEMDGKRKIEKSISVVEGRDCNQPIAEEICESAKKLGFDANIVKTISSVNISNGTLDEVFSDCVIWRGPVDMKSMYETERVISYLNSSGKLLINANPAGGRICTSNKFFQHGLFQLEPLVNEHSLPMHMALSRVNIDDLLKRKKLKFPFLLKPDLGTRGEDIVLIESEKDLDKFDKDYHEYSTETYIKSTYDWRVFVLGGVALGAMRKQGDMEDRSNFMSRSSGRQHWREDDPEILEEINDLAVRASGISGLEYAGIDIIRDDETGKFIVLETNIAAGWQNGFFETTGVSVSEEIVKWFADRMLLTTGPVYRAVRTFCDRRYRFLSRASQKDYNEILQKKHVIKRDKEICRFDIQSSDIPVVRKLSSAYALVTSGDLSESDVAMIKVLLSSVEEYEISRFGNYIGRDSFSFEESLKRTAYYLAVKEALDAGQKS